MSIALQTRAVPTEQLISVDPFVVRRRVAFRDCDPAGIVYTPRFLDPFATGAADLFMMHVIGPMGSRLPGLETLATPAKAVELVFHGPSPQGALIDIQVACTGFGKTTFELSLEGQSEAGAPLFSIRMTLICVTHDSFKAIGVPDGLREALSAYVSEGTKP